MAQLNNKEISTEQAETVVSALSAELKNIESKLAEYEKYVEVLMQKRRDIKNFIELIDFSPEVNKIKNENYNHVQNDDSYELSANSGSWWDKVRFIFEQELKPLTASEVRTIFFELNPELVKDEKAKNKAQGNIFAILSSKFNKTQLRREMVDNEFVYSPSTWYDDLGNLYPKFKNKTTP